MSDTARKSAESGYLTSRPVDVAQDVIVRETDCGTDRGLTVSESAVGAELIEPLIDRLIGRTLFETVKHPETNQVIVESDTVITEDQAKQVIEAGIEEVTIRSAFTCNTKDRKSVV